MYKVMVCEDTRESAIGDSYELNEYVSLEDAHREARAGKMAYLNGNAWVENELGEVVPDPILKAQRKERRTQKLNLLRSLETQGIVRENCPEADEFGDTTYWPFEVLKPDQLPTSLRVEYKRLGELRW